ncbi:MAG: hypothetical protein M1575_03300 [Patescibacteria group bacterium]|nr:hypothetical protein [Patescibacteria group bacterium]MCL5095727.1 hypothetical protein [Patescibacteria group bacterium]
MMTKKEDFILPITSELIPSHELENSFRIVCDIDETLADSWGDYIPLLNARFGTNLTPEEVAVHGYVQNVPAWCSFAKELSQVMNDLRCNSEFVKNHRTVEGSVKGLWRLTEIGRLIAYVTSRPDGVYQTTVEWLRNNGYPEAEVICMPAHLLLTPQEKIWKQEKIGKLGAHLMIDDNVDLAENLRMSTIIIDGHHNKLVVPRGAHITKASHWDYVPEQAALIKKEWLERSRRLTL